MVTDGRYLAAKTVSDVWICYPWEATYVFLANCPIPPPPPQTQAASFLALVSAMPPVSCSDSSHIIKGYR